MSRVLLQHDSEKKDILLRRSSEIDEQRSALLRRVMIAETGDQLNFDTAILDR